LAVIFGGLGQKKSGRLVNKSISGTQSLNF